MRVPDPASRVFTVPAGVPFLDTIATAILNGELPPDTGAAPGPLDLAGYTLLLPTRRAVRAAHEAFLRIAGNRAILLPSIRPIAESEEDLGLLTGFVGLPDLAPGPEDLPPAVSALERRLILTRLVRQWSQAMRGALGETGAATPFAGAATPAQAVRLADELARLIDMVETEGVDLSGMTRIVPDDYSQHWQHTLDFLKIVLESWPAILAEQGRLSPMDRRNRLVAAEARRYAASPPPGPVIIAGVTGSIPATQELMRVVAGLASGCIVLPALDLWLDAESWDRIRPGPIDPVGHPEHPQYGLAKMLATIGVPRSAVRLLRGAPTSAHGDARARLMSEAMRPSATTERWHRFVATCAPEAIGDALAGVTLIEAPNAADEAEAIALILREALETPGRTAALVSPDRRLARRVAIRLESWGIMVDDSAGRPFGKTPLGTFLELALDVIRHDFAPAAVMALLKHPLTRLGKEPREIRFAARALEIAVFRTLYLGRGPGGIATALDKAERDVSAGDRRERAVRRLRPDDWGRAHWLAKAIQRAFAPMMALREEAESPISRLADAHIETAERLSAPPPREEVMLWAGETGEAASLFFAGLMDDTLSRLSLAPADYPDFYRTLIAEETVRQRAPVHPRLAIWGPLEARLQQPDVIVLGSLNEGTWPEAVDPGPWLNRPMRKQLGLPQPEERIGFAAHDFSTLSGAPTLYLTRAVKIDGVPTVPSRWLLRLKALLEGANAVQAIAARNPWLGWARQRDAVALAAPVSAPEPRPPLALRPRRLSVSDVESWITNPYALFAKRILGLESLPALGAEPDAALRGSILHEALGRFVTAHPSGLPPDPEGTLLCIIRDILREFVGDARVAAFWVPRFERFATWFAETEPRRRAEVTAIAAEVPGTLSIEGGAGPFELTARADRIDQRSDGLVITDYKTGALPSEKHARSGAAPQLALEAAIAARVGFGSMPQEPVAALRYIRASGGEPAGVERDIAGAEVTRLADDALAGLERLVRMFDEPATPYRAVRRARFKYDFDDYAHLARVKEWLGDARDEDGAP